MNLNYTLLMVGLFGVLPIHAQITFNLKQYPANTPLADTLFLAGTFNDWNPQDVAYQFQSQEDGTYQITFTATPGPLAYKVTRGNWDRAETKANGGFQPDHMLNYSGGEVNMDISVANWQDLAGLSRNSTATSNVSLLKKDFYIPQLQRFRCISIYLPPDYQSSAKRYPVLYLQDGQNMFDAGRSSFGEWRIDETLNQLFDDGDYGVIAVAIDHGDIDRINEYAPYSNPQYGGGQGDAYARFLVETLKPYIDQHFRTLPGRENTGILGSSMGGLIAQYTAMEYQEVFGKAGVLSPSFWFSEMIFQQPQQIGKKAPMRIYYMGGTQESSTLVSHLRQMQSTLNDLGFTPNEETIVVTHPDGQHSEWYWAREFSNVYQWLFGEGPVITDTEEEGFEDLAFTVAPNPAHQFVEIKGISNLSNPTLSILSIDGKYLWHRNLDEPTIDISSLRPGTYIFQISDGAEQIIGRTKMVIID